MPSTAYRPRRTLYLIKQTESIVRARMDAALRAQKITVVQFSVLSLLDRPDPLSSAQVARHSFVTPQAANEMIASLEKKGLIARTEDSETRRILRLTLTPAGSRILARSAKLVDRVEKEILRNLTPRKTKDLRQALLAIIETAREDAAR